MCISTPRRTKIQDPFCSGRCLTAPVFVLSAQRKEGHGPPTQSGLTPAPADGVVGHFRSRRHVRQRTPRKRENAASSGRQIAGHDSLSSQGSPAYMQISCRLGCQPDHLLDSTQCYFRSSTNSAIGETRALQHQTSARDEPADLPAGNSSGCSTTGTVSLRATVADPWRAAANTRNRPCPFGQDNNGGTDRNTPPCPHQASNPHTHAVVHTDNNAHLNFGADQNTIANGNGNTDR